LLTTSWNLPQMFVDVTSHHHDRPKTGPLDLAGVIAFACRVADSLGFEFVPNPECESYQMIISQLPQPVRDRMPADPNEIAARITDKISCIESMRSSSPARDSSKAEQEKAAVLSNLGHPSSSHSVRAQGRTH